jgi:hypothetical protein
MMVTKLKKIKLPRRPGVKVKKPFAEYLNAMPKVGLELDIAAYYRKQAAKVGCDLTTMINDVLERAINDDEKRKAKRSKVEVHKKR